MTFEKIISSFFEEEKAVTAVFIFGSYATGRNTRGSDIDIGILLKKDGAIKSAEIESKCVIELARLLRKDIHPVILNSASVTLLRQVFLKGKCILDKDTKSLAIFKMRAFAMIAEFEYFKTKMQRGFVNRIAEG